MSATVFETRIGDLEIVEVFEFYDGPILFSCKSASGQLFIAYLVAELESGNRWFLSRVSKLRLSIIRTGDLSVRDAFLRPEDGWIWDCVVTHDKCRNSAGVLAANEIDADLLPEASFSLALSDDRLARVSDDAVTRAKQLNREVLTFAIQTPDGRHRIEADKLAPLLSNTQQLVYALGHSDKMTRGRFPAEVIRKNTFYATDLKAGSVVVMLESASPSDLYGRTEASEAAGRLAEVLAAVDRAQDLVQLLLNAGPRATAHCKHLLRTIRDRELSISFEWGSPSGKSRTARLDMPTAKATLQYLDRQIPVTSELQDFHGRLVGVDVFARSFAFTTHEGQRIKGAYHESFQEGPDLNLDMMQGVPALIEVQVVISVNPATDEEEVEYYLTNIRPDPLQNAPEA